MVGLTEELLKMKSKKAKILTWLAVVVSLLGAYRLEYHKGYASRGPWSSPDPT